MTFLVGIYLFLVLKQLQMHGVVVSIFLSDLFDAFDFVCNFDVTWDGDFCL